MNGWPAIANLRYMLAAAVANTAFRGKDSNVG